MSGRAVRRMAWPRAPRWTPLLLLFAACGDDGPGSNSAAAAPEAVACGAPRLAAIAAAPFDWVAVEGIPEGFGPVGAEVTAAGVEETLLAPVYTSPEGVSELRVPVHPSFRIAGGEVSVRIYAGPGNSCEPVPLAIAALAPAPGALAEATRELRAALEEIVAPGGGGGSLAAALERPGRALSIFAIPALWALPELEALEALLAEDALARAAPGTAEMLDALAAKLELADRMRLFRGVVRTVGELAGELPVPTPGPVASGAFPARLAAAISPAPLWASSPSAAARPRASECPTDRSNLFGIDEPARLDDLMRAQDYAQRFLAGANDQAGGSASGTVFGDLGVLMGIVGMLGKQGEAAGKVWEAFSTVVLNTAEAFANLLPGDMRLTLDAAPKTFEEDSEETGHWTASATATSRGMKLTDQVIEKVMEKALEKGLADASIGKPLKERIGAGIPDEVLDETTGKAAVFWNDVGDRAAEKVDAKAKKATKQAVKDLLKAIGATEGPNGFDIPGGCWTLPDMSDGGGGGSPAPGGGGPSSDAGGPAGAAPPPLVTAHLSGAAVEFVEDGTEPPRAYEAAAAGTSRLEVRTAEGYRKSFEWQSGLQMAAGGSYSVATTYAFGGDQYTAVARIEVLPIEVDLYPSIIVIEPGEPVPFAAVVRNAVDTRLRWTRSAGEFDELIDNGDGSHEAVFFSPKDAKLYPIRIEAISVTETGARARPGRPDRKAVAVIQLAHPVIDIRPAGDCVAPEGEVPFTAQVLGVEGGEVRWTATEGNIGRTSGRYRAPRSPGTYQVTATWTADQEVRSSVDVEVGECAAYWVASVSGGRYAGTYRGSDARALVRDGRVIGLILRSDAGSRPYLTIDVSAPRQPFEAGTGRLDRHGSASVTFFPEQNDPYAGDGPVGFGSGAYAEVDARFPPPATVELREVSEARVTGAVFGVFWGTSNPDGSFGHLPEVRAAVRIEFRAEARRHGG